MKTRHRYFAVGLLALVATVDVRPELVTWIPFQGQKIEDLGSVPKSVRSGGVQLESDPFSPANCSSLAATFNGQDSFCELEGSGAMNLLPLSIVFWVKGAPQPGLEAGLVTKYGIASANGFGIFQRADRVRAWYFGSGGSVYNDTQLVSAPCFDGLWHHVAVTFDNSGGKLYVDGRLNDSLGWGGNPSACTTTIPVLVGEYRTPNLSERRRFFSGRIADIRIMNSALTAEQIAAQFIAQVEGVFDTDSDGFPDHMEFANRSKPNDAQSLPELLIVRVNGRTAFASEIVSRGPASVSAQSSFKNGVVLYTLDGSDPSLASTLYTGAFAINRSTALRMAAYSGDLTERVEMCRLDIVIAPTLTTSTAGPGVISVEPPDGRYRIDGTALVTAIPADGWRFLHWLGDATGTNSSKTLQMTGNKCVQAVFGAEVKTSIVGDGTILQTPLATSYPYGTTVRFDSLPAPASFLSFWTGPASSSDASFELIVTNSSATVTAVFQPLVAGQVALAVIIDGRGSVASTPRATRYSAGATVKLTAIPAAGQEFVGWAGDASGNSSVITVTMDKSRTVTARFTTKPILSVRPCLDGFKPEGFRFTLVGEFGAVYRVSRSIDFTDWLPIGSATNTYGTVQFTDPDPVASPQFYRVSD